QFVKAKRKLDLHFLKPQSLLLYTNCVLPSLVGGSYGNFLTHIPIPKNDDADSMNIPFTVHEPKNLEFHPIKTGSVKNIQMKLLKTDGTKPAFAVDDIRIFVTLVLRLRPLTRAIPNKQTTNRFFKPQ
ncbi:MAG: hypothetical protein AAFR83_23250, partial [Cyanobacteria bacterium J06629_18]